MREYFGGMRFWNKCSDKYEKKKKEMKIGEEREKFFEKNRQRKEGDYQLLYSWYQEKVTAYYELYKKHESKRRHKNARIREKGRRGSDGLFTVKFDHEEFRKDVDKVVEEKRLLFEENEH